MINVAFHISLVDCGDPGTPLNGTRNFTSTLEDSIVTYSCDPGYKLIGNKTRECKVSADEGAQWKYDIPKCQCEYCYTYMISINMHNSLLHFSIVLTVAFASNEFNGTEASGSINVVLVLSQPLPSNASIILEVISTEQVLQSAEGT